MKDELNFDFIRELNVGTVESTSPKEIKVLLDTNAPQNTSLNTGVPSLFPRINGFVLVPKEVGAVVGMIDWMGVERFSSNKVRNSDVIDLPYPQRRMSIIPIGTLKKEFVDDKEKYVMERGVFSFPSVGDSVIIPDENQLKAIVKNKDKNAKINIGEAPLAANSDIYVDPDKLFGKHLAVLGNTGSGKSCSVAGMIRWSIEAAKEHIESEEYNLNSRFIVLDPNGEYKPAFEDLDNEVGNYRVYLAGEETQQEVNSFNLPAWMWNSFEWSSLTRAQPGAQRPVLLDALRGIKSGRKLEEPQLLNLRRFLNGQKINIENYLGHPPSTMTFGQRIGCGQSFENFAEDLQQIYLNLDYQTDENLNEDLVLLRNRSEEIRNSKTFVWNDTTAYNTYTESELKELLSLINQIIDKIDNEHDFSGFLNENSADSPINFSVLDLPDYLANVATQQEANLSQFVSFLSMRIRFLINDERLKNVVNPGEDIRLEDWLNDFLSGSQGDNSSIVILDLSLIPSDVIHIIIAVFARLIFEALQRYRKENGKELPTVLALEEAHTFVNRSFSSNNDIQSYNELCLRIFERISREGRKFGLSLILSSQRPSEISPTVLSQCNSFLLHRIVNDRDQALVKRLVPDNIGSLLNEIPTLPSQKAILVGLATSIPLLLTIRNLPEAQRPKSEDPKFWDVWTGREQRDVDWQPIVEKWQGIKADGNDTVQ